MSKTVLEEVKEKIKAIEDRRVSEKLELKERITKAQAEEADAREAVYNAAAVLNSEAHAKAAEREARAHNLVRMYEEKARQIQSQEDISEEESDRIIDSLLAYSKGLDADFTEAVKKKAEDLRKMNEAYEEEARETERIINYWCDHVHANYNTRGRTTYYVDGKATHRSPVPVPVIMRHTPWTGCSASNALQDFLSRLEDK